MVPDVTAVTGRGDNDATPVSMIMSTVTAVGRPLLTALEDAASVVDDILLDADIANDARSDALSADAEITYHTNASSAADHKHAGSSDVQSSEHVHSKLPVPQNHGVSTTEP